MPADQGATVRLAETCEDKAKVFSFRYQTYCVQQQLFLDVADHDRRWLRDVDDEDGLIWLAEQDGEAVGTLRANVASNGAFSEELTEIFDLEKFVAVIDAERIAVLSRFIVAPQLRGGMVSGGLMAHAAQYGIAHRMDTVFCDCEPHLVDLYRRIGFRPFKPLYNHPTSGLLVPLVLLLSDRDHLVRVNSLMLALIPEDFPHTAEASLLELIGSDVVRSPDTRLFADMETRANGDVDTPSSLLDGLTVEERERLFTRSNVLSVRSGDALIRASHVSRTVYVVLDGTFQITVGEQIVGVAVPGDFFGEIALLLDASRTAEVRAVTPGEVVAVSDRVLQRLIVEEPAIASKVLLNFSRGLARKLLAWHGEH
jgi:predicted GNAT family N-acyltransferase